MTEKELLYVEDALSHQECAKIKFKTYSNVITDQNLKEFTKTLEAKNTQLFNNFLNLLK